MTVPGRRLPFGPLTESVGPIWQKHIGSNGFARACYPDDTWQIVIGNPTGLLSELTGYSRRTLVRWVSEGIPIDAADRIAVKLGRHVSEIWTEWWDLVEQETA